MRIDETTMVAVPLSVWLATKKTIGKLPIEENVDLWIALNQCKPLVEPPPTSPPAVPAGNGSTAKKTPAGSRT